MTDRSPLVSVVIPAFNSEQFLSAALESVFVQDYRPMDVIVVDDGSVDRTGEIARSYSQVRYFLQANQGHAAAKNAGIAAARGEFIAFLDADDLWLPNKLSMQIGYLLQHPQVGYVIARMHVIVETGAEWPAHLNREHYLQDPVCYLPSALLMRKNIIHKVGLFDLRYRYSDDGDWFLRANDVGVPMAVIPQVLVQKRIHSLNQSHERPTTAETFAAVRASVRRKRHPE